MADEAADEGDGEDVPKKRLSGKRIVMFIVAPVILLLGILAGLYFAGVFDMLFGGDEKKAEKKKKKKKPPIEKTGKAVFYEMDSLLVALSSKDKQNYLKLKLALQVNNSAAKKELKRIAPRVTDEFQAYLRELRIQDLQGSEGLYRLREELLRRANLAAEKAEVRDVLVREMLVQ